MPDCADNIQASIAPTDVEDDEEDDPPIPVGGGAKSGGAKSGGAKSGGLPLLGL
jgi:hypothetical protein